MKNYTRKSTSKMWQWQWTNSLVSFSVGLSLPCLLEIVLWNIYISKPRNFWHIHEILGTIFGSWDQNFSLQRSPRFQLDWGFPARPRFVSLPGQSVHSCSSHQEKADLSMKKLDLGAAKNSIFWPPQCTYKFHFFFKKFPELCSFIWCKKCALIGFRNITPLMMQTDHILKS